MLIGRDRRRQLQELRLRAGIRLSLQRAEFPLRPVERLGAPVLRPVQDLLVDATVLPDREHHHRGAHVDQLEPDELLVGGARRDGDPGVLGQPGQQHHRALQHLLEVEDRFGEMRSDRPSLNVLQPAARR